MTDGSVVVLVNVFESTEEGGAETVVSAGEVAGEGGLGPGFGDSVGGRGRLMHAARHSARGGGEGGGDVEEDYVGGGRLIEESGGGLVHWRVRAGVSAMQVRRGCYSDAAIPTPTPAHTSSCRPEGRKDGNCMSEAVWASEASEASEAV